MPISDSSNRTIDVNLTAKEIAALLMANVTTEVLKVSDEDTHTILDEIKKLDTNISTEITEISTNLKSLVDFFMEKKGTVGGLETTTTKPDKKKDTDDKKEAEKKKTIKDAAADGSVAPNKALQASSKAITAINIAAQGISRAAQTVVAEYGIGIDKVFSGVIANAFSWQTSMAQIRFEQQGINGSLQQTKKEYDDIGSVVAETGMNRNIFQEQYIKQLRMGQTMEMTGGRMQQRSLLQTRQMLKNTLATATMIGSDAGQTIELFGEWNRHLGLTNNQLGYVGRSMEQIAHVTGVSGDNLLKAAQTATQVGKEVFKYSGISDRAMSSLIQQQAAFSKYGVQEVGTKIQQALAGGVRTFSAADPRLQAWMARSAGGAGVSQAELMSGAANDPATMARIQRGMMQDAQGFLRNSGMTGNLKNLTTELQGIQNIDPRRAMVLREQIQNIFGVGAGELQQFAKAQKEAFANPQQRIVELQQQKAGLTGAGATARGQAIDTQIQQIQAGTRRQDLSQFQSQLQASGGNIETALIEFNQQRAREAPMRETQASDVLKEAGLTGNINTMVQELNQLDPRKATQLREQVEGILGSGAQMNVTQIQEMGKNVAGDLETRAGKVNVNFLEELKKKGVSSVDELSQGLVSGNSEAMQSILDEIENKVKIRERAESDPILKLQLLVNEVNEYLKQIWEYFSKNLGFKALTAVVATLGAITLAGAAASTVAGSGIMSFLLGGGGAAGAAATGAAVTGGTGAVAAGTAATGAAVTGGTGLAAGTVAGTGAVVGGGGVVGGSTAVVAGGASVVGTGGTILIVAAAAAAILGAIGGVVGGFKAGAKAAEIFGVEQSKLTIRQKQAAEGAGTLTGALNFLTFGIFNKTLGPMGTLTQKLALLFDKFWIFGSIFSSVTNMARIAWGTIKGIWRFIVEFFTGLWDGVMAVVNPLMDAWSQIWDAIKEPIAELMNIFGGSGEVLADSVDIVESIASTWQWFGKAIGDSFRWIGSTLGWLIKEVTPYFVAAWRKVGAFIREITPIVKKLWEAAKVFFSGLWEILAGIFAFDFTRVWAGIKEIFTKFYPLMFEVYQEVGAIIWRLIKAFATQFLPWLWTQIVKGLWNLVIFMTTKFPGMVIGGIMRVIKAVFYDFPVWLSGRIREGLEAVWQDLPDWLKNILEPIYKIVDGIVGFFNKIKDFLFSAKDLISNLPNTLANFVKEFWNKLYNGIIEWKNKIVDSVTDWIGSVYDGLKNFVTTFWTNLEEKARTAFTAVVDWILDKLNLRGATRGAGETAAQHRETREREGNTVGHGIGGIYGGLRSIFSGEFREGDNRVGSGLGEIGSAAGSSVSDFFSRINPFAIGTQEIQKPGVGLLHAGEAVIPASIWQTMQNSIAKGSQPNETIWEQLTPQPVEYNLANAFASLIPRGKVSTSMFPPDEAETYVAKHVYENKPKGAATLIPGMEGILNYLSGNHDKKLDELVDIMKDIKEHLMKGSSDILLPDNSVTSTDRSGLRNWVKGRITGQWIGEQDPAYQEQLNATGDSIN